MIRLFFFAFMFPFVIVLVWDDAPRWAIWAGWAIGGAVLLLMYLRGNLVLKCPNCGKRVKIGYTTCHHCGAAVGRKPLIGQKFAAEEVVKECEHCKSQIRPDASVCPHCQRDVQAWTLHEGTWWQKIDGEVQRLNLHADQPTWESFGSEQTSG
jgi:hypothetical protein